MPVERRADGDVDSIGGLASVFYDGSQESEYRLWDGAVERIMPGAFDRAVREDDVRALFNHDPSNLLGRTTAGTLDLRVTGEGLDYRIQLGDTTVAADVASHVSRGDLTGSSFAFNITDEEWRREDDQEIREIRGVRLYDVGPVTYPAYEASSVGTRDARASHDAWADSAATARSEAIRRRINLDWKRLTAGIRVR